MRQVQVGLRLPPGHLELIERARGLVPRNAWLKLAAIEKLERDGHATWDPAERAASLEVAAALGGQHGSP